MSADLFETAGNPLHDVPLKMPACPECANPDSCAYRFNCENCMVRMILRMPRSVQEAWMNDDIRPKVEAERERMRKQHKGQT